MSGTRHVAYIDSKQISVDKNRIVSQTDERVSYTMSTKEVPLISYNDMANIAPCNSMVFRIGGSPIWNRNQMALPMSHCIHKNKINMSGREFTLLTVPTTSSALEYDLTAMVPDFDKMLEQRLTEYETVDDAKYVYQQQTELTDSEINRMDADVYSGEIMSIVRALIAQREAEEKAKGIQKEALQMSNNEDMEAAMREEDAKHAEGRKKRYANGKLSREDIIRAGTGYEDIFYEAFMETRDSWMTNPNVICDASSLRTRDGRVLIDFADASLQEYGNRLAEETQKDGTRVYSEDQQPVAKTVSIKPEFVTWLVELEAWPQAFDAAVAKRMDNQ